MAKGFSKGFSAWRQGMGAIAIGIALSLSPWTQAAASISKKPIKTAKAPAKAAKAAKNNTANAKAAPAKTSAKSSARSPVQTASAKSGGKNTGSKSKGHKDAKARNVAAAQATKGGKAGKAGKNKHRLHVQLKPGKSSASPRVLARRQIIERPAPRLSMGQMAGLHSTRDPLALNSSVALVMDQDSHEVLFSKNPHAVLPIASLTKLMTGLIISDARLPLDELITITPEDVDTAKGSSSRLPVGTTLTRGELMHLALMSSENRAAHALGRTYPGGINRFVALMNARAIMLGMKDTRYVEPTGLSSANRSSAQDLATLVAVASADPLLRQFSTSQGYEVAVGDRLLQYSNTNRLVHNPDWQIGLQKTGYISEAGRCLVMQAQVAGRKLIMVFLDSSGKQSRLADAERVRRWVEVERAPRTVAANPFAG